MRQRLLTGAALILLTDAEALSARYQQPGMGVVLCAVPQQLREMAQPGVGWATDQWVWKVVVASGSDDCFGGPAPAPGRPYIPAPCFVPTTSFAVYDYFTGAAVMGGSPAPLSHA